MPVNIFLPQVTRIPITGSAPYNILVCVSVETLLGPQELRDGRLSRFPMRVATPFRLAGFDQRVPPVFDHSTTAWISRIGPMENGNWIWAVDSVTGAGFSPTDGTYFLDLMAAGSPDGNAPNTCFAIAQGITMCLFHVGIQVTSWVLCYEPPIVPPQQGYSPRLNDLVQQGISPADLARIPRETPRRTAAAEQIERILQPLGMSVSMSISRSRNVTSDGIVYRDSTTSCL